MANFFHSYFYGNSGRKDFTEADLPANRLQLFRDVFSVRRGSMLGLNLLMLLYHLPILFWTFLNLVQIYQIDPAADNPGQAMLGVLFSYLLVMAPLAIFTGPFSLGAGYVLRTWARDEHSFALSDFGSALKSNWKQGLLLGAAKGIAPLLVYICARFYIGMAGQSLLFYLPLALVLIVFLLWELSAHLLPAMIVTYDLRFFQHVKNAALMTLAELPRSILIRIAILGVPLLMLLAALLFPGALGWITGLGAVLYALILLAFNGLISASFANYLCEKYLNPRIEGARTDIGLRPNEVE